VGPPATGSLAPPQFARRVVFLIGFGITALAIAFCLPRQPQDKDYHQFADERELLGVPNCLNVISNAPFVVAGVLGWLALRRSRLGDGRERWAWIIFFAGMMLTGFGSSYYHWDPDNDRLVWDRLPMTLAFMSFFAAMLGERVGVRTGVGLLGPLVFLGVVSVVSWHVGERQGAGDLRLYGVVQFYPMLAIPVSLLLFPPRYTGTAFVWGALGWYLLAKVLELHAVDHGVFALGGVVSGHSLKHVAAAVGALWIAWMLYARRPVAVSEGETGGLTDPNASPRLHVSPFQVDR
jgi:hypothetical protein